MSFANILRNPVTTHENNTLSFQNARNNTKHFLLHVTAPLCIKMAWHGTPSASELGGISLVTNFYSPTSYNGHQNKLLYKYLKHS